MKNQFSFFWACCLTLAVGSVGRAESAQDKYNNCTKGCADSKTSCLAGDSSPDLICLNNEVKCFQGCIANLAANQKAELKKCLDDAGKAQSTADQAARTAFRETKVSIDSALKNAQAHGPSLAKYFPAHIKVRDDKMTANKAAFNTAAKGCWNKFGKK